MNLLVTSINAKIPLLECMRESVTLFDPAVKLFGADSNEDVLGRFFVDIFWHMPHLEVLTCNDVIYYCKAHHIAYIFPTRDHDVLFFATHEKTLKAHGIFCFVAPLESVKACFDKLAFFRAYKEHDIIATYEDSGDIRSERFVVKERFGSGSKELLVNASKEEALSHAKKLKNPIFQPFIQGEEYSIDSYIDQSGHCVGSIARKREKVVNGESKITSYTPHAPLELCVEALLMSLGLRGHIVTQALVNDKGIFIIECNARFGGASTLSYRMGLRSFLWFLCEMNSKPFTFTLNTTITRLVRVEKDVFFEH